MADAAPSPRPRPISPQVQLNGGIWRWHLTMAASILHRVTGVGLGALQIGTPGSIAGSIVGKAGFFVLTLCVFYHLANGVRHLAWDAGFGFKPQTATQTATLVIGFAIVATIALWGVLAATGAI